MKGVLLDKVGGEFYLSSEVEKPVPGKGQVLVKSLATAVNPVEPFMQGTGLMVTSWPIVLGCDASGVVVEVGEDVKKFEIGDGIYGCTVLGVPGNSTFQEYFVMNEDLAFKKPGNITTEQAATIGVGLITAALGLVIGTNIELEPHKVEDDAQWVVIFGAAGSVGQFAVQLGRLCGYKVLAVCSPENNDLVTSFGANATLSYKSTPEEQIKSIQKITNGNFSRILDASAMATAIGMEALAQNKSTTAKAPIEPKEGIQIYIATLGEIGRSGNEHIEKTNRDIRGLVPKLEKLVDSGQILPSEYLQIGDVGIEEVFKALEAFKTHKSGKKVIVRLAEN